MSTRFEYDTVMLPEFRAMQPSAATSHHPRSQGRKRVPLLALLPVFAASNALAQAPSLTPTKELSSALDSTATAIRAARASYFDKFTSPDGVALENRDPRARAATIFHSPPPKSELPQNPADTIIVGKISGIQAYLSNNRGAIYTESTIAIEEVISSQRSLAPASSLLIVQDGGSIQLASGAVLEQPVQGSGNELRNTGEYLFFLRYISSLQAYGCTKAWALVNGAAVAVSADDLARVANHVSRYQGMPAAAFLAVARKLVASLPPGQ